MVLLFFLVRLQHNLVDNVLTLPNLKKNWKKVFQLILSFKNVSYALLFLS
jgi:hypothetical protein